MSEATQRRERNGRGVAPRLDLEAIVTAGLAIASRPDVHAVTVRELGSYLGVDPTAIYRHVRSKDGLVQVLLDRIIGIAVERTVATPSRWRDYLLQTAENTLDTFIEYPAIGAEAVRLSSDGVNELHIIEGVLSAFGHAGLDDVERVRFYGVWSVYVVSFCSGVARDRMSTARGTEPLAWLGRSIDAKPGEFPEIDRNRRRLLEVTDVDAFRDGLELVLDAAERAAAGPR
jgi:AcrR family transcriptional regulator